MNTELCLSFLLHSSYDPSPRPVFAQLERYRVAWQYLDVMYPHLAGKIREYLFPLFQPHPEGRCRQRFDDDAPHDRLALVLWLSRLPSGSHVNVDIRLKQVNSQEEITAFTVLSRLVHFVRSIPYGMCIIVHCFFEKTRRGGYWIPACAGMTIQKEEALWEGCHPRHSTSS